MTGRLVPVFDLGAVLIDWRPRVMYAKRFPGREADVEYVLANAWTHEWNLATDKGLSHREAAAALAKAHPGHADLIHAYAEHWIDMLAGDIPGTVEILRSLRASEPKLYSITNWNQDTYRLAEGRFPFLKLFDGVIVSGDEKLIKPDRAIFDLLCARYGLRAEECLFIDDNAANAAGAEAAGMKAHRFVSPEGLRDELRSRGFSL